MNQRVIHAEHIAFWGLAILVLSVMLNLVLAVLAQAQCVPLDLNCMNLP